MMIIGEWVAVALMLGLIAGIIWLGHVSGAWYAKQGD